MVVPRQRHRHACVCTSYNFFHLNILRMRRGRGGLEPGLMAGLYLGALLGYALRDIACMAVYPSRFRKKKSIRWVHQRRQPAEIIPLFRVVPVAKMRTCFYQHLPQVTYATSTPPFRPSLSAQYLHRGPGNNTTGWLGMRRLRPLCEHIELKQSSHWGGVLFGTTEHDR